MLNQFFFLMMLMNAGTASASSGLVSHQSVVNASATELTLSTPAKSAQVEALLHNKLLNDPMSPTVGAEHPSLKIVSFVNYDCIHCKRLDRNLERLLKAFPQIAITYKLISYGSEASTAATRMALAVWIEKPEKFHAFHHALMRYQGMDDNVRILSALSAAGVKLSEYRPDTRHIIEVNKKLLRVLQYSGTPTTIIGNRVVSGEIPYDQLEKMVRAALKND